MDDRSRISRKSGLLALVAGLCLVGALAWAFAPLPGEWVEASYSRGLYRWIGAVVVPISSAVPVSLTFAGAAFLVVFFIVLWWCRWSRAAGEGRFWRGFFWGWTRLVFLLLFGYVLFLFLWGAGYRREPLRDRLDLGAEPPAAVDVSAFADALLAVIEAEVPEREPDVPRAVESVRDSMVELVERVDDGSGVAVAGSVKTSPDGWLLATGSAGFTSPFLLEPHVDGALPPAAFVAVAAHEMAPVAGFCTEDEADLIGMASGLDATDPFARYAVALWLYEQIADTRGGEGGRAMIERLPERARADLEAATAVVREHRVQWLARLQRGFYDSYLKSQGVDEGVASYDLGIELLVLGWRRDLVKIRD